MAWKITFPVALILVLYVYYVYNRIFVWHLSFVILFVSICLIAGSEFLFFVDDEVKDSIFEIVTVAFLLVFIILRKPSKQLITKYMSKLTPMTNNFDEMYKFILALTLILLFYLSVHFFIVFSSFQNSELYQQILRYFYLGLLVFLIIYEIFRVHYIRAKLFHEEWWPIVNEQGKIVGTIEHKTSLNDENKYMHPVVRVMLVDKNLILLQKRSSKDIVHPGIWDTAISNHVRVGESIEQCVDRTSFERYQLEKFKYMHLSNYSVEVKNEVHYTFLFVSCQLVETKPNQDYIDQTKWWTKQQIEENLDAGIFTENFKLEFDILKRSGLLDTGKCECACRLKDVIYNQAVLGANK